MHVSVVGILQVKQELIVHFIISNYIEDVYEITGRLYQFSFRELKSSVNCCVLAKMQISTRLGEAEADRRLRDLRPDSP